MGNNPESSFAKLLRTYRKAAYLTQEDLAERSRLSVRAISDLERGVNRAPRNETLALLAKALGLHGKERSAFKVAARGSPVATITPDDTAGSAEPPLIGRKHEMALLDRHLAGQGPPLLMLAGEPGIGKSRLLRVAAEYAPRHGLRVLMGGCRRSGVHPPYSPLLETLRRLLQEFDGEDLTRTLRGCAWLVRLLPELRDGPIEPLPTWSLPPDQEKRLMADAVRQLLVNIARPNGALLILDDLQWARADALDLLATLAHASSEIGMRIVGAYRDTEVKTGDSFFHFLADLTQTGVISRHSLGPLAPDEAAHLLHELVGAQTARIPRQRTLEQAGGVPFFLVSLAYLLRESPRRDRDGREEGIGRRGLPWTLVQAVQQRVAVLGEDVRELLGVAAVIGRVVPRTLLSRVLGWPEPKMLPLLETACGARLLEENGAHQYRFSHDVIREVLEADLSTARRTMLHALVADTLVADLVDPPVERVAFHYGQTEDHAAAASWLERAADRASAALAQESAIEFYRAAIVRAQAGSADRTTLSRLHERLGDLCRLRLDLDSAIAAFAEARDLETDRARRADLLRKEGVAWTVAGNPAAALISFAEAEVEGGIDLPPIIRVALLTDRAFCRYILCDFASAETDVAYAIDLLNNEVPSRTVDLAFAPAFWVRAVLRDIRGDVVGGRADSEQLLILGRRLNDPQFVGRALLGLGVCDWREARLDQAEERFRAAQAAVGRVSDAEYTAGSGWGLGCVYYLRGDLKGAQSHLDQALETANLGQHPYFVALIWEELGKVACGQGNLEEAQERFGWTLATRKLMGDQRGIAQSWNGLGMVAVARGDFGQAAARHRNARRLARRCDAFYAEIDALIGHAQVCLRQASEGRPTSRLLCLAEALLDRVRLLLEGRSMPGYSVQLALLNSELQLDRNMPAAARQSAVGALRQAEELKLQRMTAESRLLLGRCDLADGNSEDAKIHLRDGLDLLVSLGFSLTVVPSGVLRTDALGALAADSDNWDGVSSARAPGQAAQTS